jgi:hypothetical protein
MPHYSCGNHGAIGRIKKDKVSLQADSMAGPLHFNRSTEMGNKWEAYNLKKKEEWNTYGHILRVPKRDTLGKLQNHKTKGYMKTENVIEIFINQLNK